MSNGVRSEESSVLVRGLGAGEGELRGIVDSRMERAMEASNFLNASYERRLMNRCLKSVHNRQSFSICILS